MDFVILSNDQAIFDAFFAPAIIVPVPGTITGSGLAKSGNRAACVFGDEASVVVPGVTYVTPTFTQPGLGVLTILSLGGNQQATQTTSGERALILKGTKFRAQFQVQVPAMNPLPPSGPVPDGVPLYTGSGSFLSTNAVTRAA